MTEKHPTNPPPPSGSAPKPKTQGTPPGKGSKDGTTPDNNYKPPQNNVGLG